MRHKSAFGYYLLFILITWIFILPESFSRNHYNFEILFYEKKIYNKLYTLNCLFLVRDRQCDSLDCDSLQLLLELPLFFPDGYMCSMALRILCDIWNKCTFIYLYSICHVYSHISTPMFFNVFFCIY